MSTKVYPDVPELGWLTELIEGVKLDLLLHPHAENLQYVYKYVLWLRRMNLSTPQSDPFLIAFGFVVKYRALIFGMQLSKADQKTVAISEREYKKLRRGRDG